MLFISILLSPLAGYYAYTKGRSPWGWFIGAFLTNSFIVLIILFFVRRIGCEERVFHYAAKLENGIDVNSPVRLEHYSVFTNNKHNQAGLVFTIRNVGNQTITAVSFIAEGYSENGSKLQFNTDGDYRIPIQNILLDPSQTYYNNTNTIIPLIDASIHRIHLEVQQVLFADGSVFINEPRIETIHVDKIPDYARNLAKSYLPEAHVFCEEHEHYWICSCGAVNLKEKQICYRCKRDKQETFKVMTRDNFRPIFNEANSKNDR